MTCNHSDGLEVKRAAWDLSRIVAERDEKKTSPSVAVQAYYYRGTTLAGGWSRFRRIEQVLRTQALGTTPHIGILFSHRLAHSAQLTRPSWVRAQDLVADPQADQSLPIHLDGKSPTRSCAELAVTRAIKRARRPFLGQVTSSYSYAFRYCWSVTCSIQSTSFPSRLS